MRFGHYKLEGRTPVQVDVSTMEGLLAWAAWSETADRHVAHTEVAPGIRVSTVFLGLDHSFGRGAPLLYETMAFDDYGDIGGIFDRYETWDQAERGHSRAVEDVKERVREREPTKAED